MLAHPENNKKPTNIFHENNLELLIIKAGCTYSYNRALKGTYEYQEIPHTTS
jgi:hypothetical protein